MKRILMTICLASILASIAPPTLAASKNECAIWMCLPFGFPDGCGGALKAMKKRIWRFKSPLPNPARCVVQPSDGTKIDLKQKHGWAAYIPAHKECIRWKKNYSPWDSIETGTEPQCVEWQYYDEQFIRGTRCKKDEDETYPTPRGCTATYKWAEVYKNGALAGPPYYTKYRDVN